MGQTLDFLRHVHGLGVVSGHAPALFCLPSRRFYQDSDFGALEKRALAWAESEDVYISCGAAMRAPSSGRHSVEDITCIPGAWVDFDIAGKGHKKIGLPPNANAVQQILDAVRMEPSLLVMSGHGLQAWWLLDDPIIISDADGRAAAQRFIYRWWATVAYCAKSLGFVVDPCHDLARVFRLPGTVNRKVPDDPVAVELQSFPEDAVEPFRWSRSDFDDFAIPEDMLQAAFQPRPRGDTAARPAMAPVSPVVIGQDAPDWLRYMCEADRKLELTFLRKRTDTQAWKDTSPSAYDMALAAIMASAGVEDQKIADAIYWSRKTAGHDLKKSMRRDYLMRTILAAKRSVAEREKSGFSGAATAVELPQNQLSSQESCQFSEIGENSENSGSIKRDLRPSAAGGASLGDLGAETAVCQALDAASATLAAPVKPQVASQAENEASEAALPPVAPSKPSPYDRFSEWAGFGVSGLIKHGREDSIYSLMLKDGRQVLLGTAEKLLSQDKTRAAIMDAVHRVLPVVKKDRWHAIVGLLLSECTVVENDEALRVNSIKESLRIYIGNHPPAYDDVDSALKLASPYVQAGRLHISLSHYLRWSRIFTGENPQRGVISDALRLAGFAPTKVRAASEEDGMTYWRGPAGFLAAKRIEIAPKGENPES